MENIANTPLNNGYGDLQFVALQTKLYCVPEEASKRVSHTMEGDGGGPHIVSENSSYVEKHDAF